MQHRAESWCHGSSAERPSSLLPSPPLHSVTLAPASLQIDFFDMGFEKEIIRAGTGAKPSRGQTVTVHCTGYGKNRNLNEKFWSTKDPGQEPFKFKLGLGQVIKGWDEGVMSMSIGEIARLKCSPDYAYGAGGFPAWGIMPNSVLVFEIEVLGAA